MIVIGVDPHKKSHTAVAVNAVTGEVMGQITVAARRRGHERLVAWASYNDRAQPFVWTKTAQAVLAKAVKPNTTSETEH